MEYLRISELCEELGGGTRRDVELVAAHQQRVIGEGLQAKPLAGLLAWKCGHARFHTADDR